MKFAFSTLGCPSWEWREILAAAKDLGYDGIEIRGIGKELYAPHISYFCKENLTATKEKLASLGLEIPCLTSACHLFNEDEREKHLQIGYDYIDLADNLGTPYIRVMGDLSPQPQAEVDIAFVRENLLVLADYAAKKSVTVLLESNGVFADSFLLRELMESLDHPQVGVLWDVHHPYRFCLEKVEDTYGNLKPYIRYLHMKDSVMENEDVEYRTMGAGDIPNKTVLRLLAKDNFAGYVSLEWTKRWNKNLCEPGIVFPQFINYARAAIK
ncbi:MAG: sugar phosphate isomerase/epimerase family protein [Clostridiales bacterium]